MFLKKITQAISSVEQKFYYLSLTLFFKTIINFLFLFYIAKVVSLADFGSFTFSFVIMTIWILFIDYGYNLHSLVLDYKNEKEINAFISAIISGKIFISIFLLGTLLLLFTPLYSEDKTVILLLSIAAIPNSFGNFFYALFKAKNQYKYESIGFILQGSILLFLLLINHYFGSVDIITFSIIVLITKVIYFIYAYIKFKNEFHIKFRLNLSNAIKSYKSSFSFGIHLIFGTLILYIETLLLRYFTDVEIVGYYQSGLRLIMAASLFGVIITDGFVPEISKTHKNTNYVTGKMKNLFEFLSVFYFLLLLTFGFYFNTIISILFDAKFDFIKKYAIYIMLIILFRAIAIVPGIILTSTGLQKIRAKTGIYAIILSIVLNLILIPKFGLEGAFISFLTTNILISIMYVFYSLKKIYFMRTIPLYLIIILIVYLFLQYSFSIDNKMFFLITIVINLLIQLLVQKSLKKINVAN